MPLKRWLNLIVAKPEIILGVAACLSLLLILLPKTFLIFTIGFDPTIYQADLRNDRYSNGNSEVMWLDQENQKWRCIMGTAFINPYCSLHIPVVDKQGKGLDLSRVHKMKIWMDYEGSGQHVRLYLRNRSAATYVQGDEVSTKYNAIEIPVAGLADGVEISMSDFTVASWWLIQRNIPLSESKPEFNDIAAIEIQTGSASSSGVHDYQLKRIEWQGPFISELGLYRAITIIWTILIVAFLALRLLNMRKELKQQQSYQRELLTINDLLSIQNKRFEDLAKTDPLTGLLNRAGIRDDLHQGMSNWKKNQTAFSLILIDIDHFKKVNDTFGHDIGDEILKGAAEVFRRGVRQTDRLVRWGGEEFVLLCPNTNRVQAMSAAESLRKRLEESSIHPDIKVTASFGVATITHADLDHLFRRADEALYRAKHQGRNCVVSDAEISP